jgi:hypothetical protein
MIVAANLSGQPDLWSATACRRFGYTLLTTREASCDKATATRRTQFPVGT